MSAQEVEAGGGGSQLLGSLVLGQSLKEGQVLGDRKGPRPEGTAQRRKGEGTQSVTLELSHRPAAQVFPFLVLRLRTWSSEVFQHLFNFCFYYFLESAKELCLEWSDEGRS